MLTQVVVSPGQPAPTSTSTLLASSANPSTTGQHVTYTVTVTPIPDGGTVRFLDDGKTVAGCGAVAVGATSGHASCRATYALAGTHGVQAAYSGSRHYTSSQSSTLVQKVVLGAVLRGSPSGRSGAVTFRVRCAAQSGGCRVTGIISTVETVHGHTIVAVAAGARRERHLVEVGSRTVTVRPGDTRTITVRLNGTGRKLLARFQALPVELVAVLSVDGQKSTVGAKAVMVRLPKAHRRTPG
jgi:Big-like domain-containing protein